MRQLESQRVDNHNKPVVMLSEDDGQPLHTPRNGEQPMNTAESKSVNGQLCNVEDFLVPSDVGLMPNNVDHWSPRFGRSL